MIHTNIYNQNVLYKGTNGHFSTSQNQQHILSYYIHTDPILQYIETQKISSSSPLINPLFAMVLSLLFAIMVHLRTVCLQSEIHPLSTARIRLSNMIPIHQHFLQPLVQSWLLSTCIVQVMAFIAAQIVFVCIHWSASYYWSFQLMHFYYKTQSASFEKWTSYHEHNHD